MLERSQSGDTNRLKGLAQATRSPTVHRRMAAAPLCVCPPSPHITYTADWFNKQDRAEATCTEAAAGRASAGGGATFILLEATPANAAAHAMHACCAALSARVERSAWAVLPKHFARPVRSAPLVPGALRPPRGSVVSPRHSLLDEAAASLHRGVGCASALGVATCMRVLTSQFCNSLRCLPWSQAGA